MTRSTALIAALLASATILPAVPAFADELQDGFQNPPNSARPRVWWHWMNGNITKDGIAKDMAWMKRIGIGGLQNFDANLQTPQIVDQRLVYMTPAWKDAFKFTAEEAERNGLELAIAASPGWSETGGPWVKPEDGLKKLVWSETAIVGGKPFKGKLAAPPGVTGPYQNMTPNKSIDESLSGVKAAEPPHAYGDIAVLAVPVPTSATADIPVAALDGGGTIDASILFDADLTSGVDVPRGSATKPSAILITYAKPQTIRSASLFVAGAKSTFAGASVAVTLQSSDDGTNWRKVADLPVDEVPATKSFAPVTAARFRAVFTPQAANLSNLMTPSPGIDLGAMAGFAAMAGGTKGFDVRRLALSPDVQIDHFETKAGFSISQDYYALGNPGDGAAGADPAKVIDLTSKLRPDGSLDWTPPKGPWRVLRFGWSLLGTTNHPAPPEATGLEVDKFDGEAVRRYIDHYIGMYRQASGGLIGGKGVRAILTDSIEVGAANWTPKMVSKFKALRGYDPTPWMPALAGVLVGSRDDSDKFLFDYRRTLADLMASEHYGTVAKAAHENGLIVYGEALEDNRPSLGDDMSMRSHADVPMAAMWTHSREQGPKPSYLADIKGAASVAHIYGQNLVAAESMTSALSYWADSPRTLKRIIDLEFVTGVNRPVIHTSVHQPRDDKFPGLSLFIFGQYFNRHEAWADLAKPWVDYMSRTAFLLQQGRNVADVGYVYGEEGPLTGLYGKVRVADASVSSAYDFVSADALLGKLSNDGSDVVAAGGARYKALYLGGSSRMMSLPVLTKIAALAESGATIIGKPPLGNPGLAGDKAQYQALVAKLWPGSGDAAVGKGRVIVADDAEAGLRAMGVTPDVAIKAQSADADIPFLHRKLVDGDVYFLVNRKNRAETVEARFRVTGKAPQLWNAMTGERRAVSYRTEGDVTVVPLNMVAEDAQFIIFRDPGAGSAMIKAPETISRIPLTAPWTVTFQPGRGAPSGTVMKTLQPLNENADDGIKHFSGIATYTTSFALPKNAKAGQPLWLDLGTVNEIAEVSVNGTLAGYSWFAPDRVDIGKFLKVGTNTLSIRVANLWINRLAGDAALPAEKRITFTAMPSYTKTAPLRPSGLIGPVSLVVEGK